MRTRPEIEAELAKCRHVHPSEATRIGQLETSLKETLHLMDLIEGTAAPGADHGRHREPYGNRAA